MPPPDPLPFMDSDPTRAKLEAVLSDRYRMVRQLAAFGGVTYFLAEDLRHGRPVSIKVFPPEVADAPAGEAFLHEVQAAARLQHPHILPLLDSRRASGVLVVVTPYVEGETLRERLQRRGPLGTREVLHILADLADALAYAHARGLARLDLSPDTALLSGRHVMLLPGLAPGATDSTPADDLARLGALGCELLTGRRPADGSALEALRREAGPDVARVIEKCISPVPEERWPSADALLAGLEPLLTPGGVTPVETRPVLRSRRLLRWAAAGSLVVLTLVALTVLRGRNRRAPAAPSRQLTYEGSVLEAAVSPDGRSLAYVVTGDSVDRLLLRDLGSGQPRTLVSGHAITTVQWIQGGSEISFMSVEGGAPVLRAVSRLGDRLRLIPISGMPVSVSPSGRWAAVWLSAVPEILVTNIQNGDSARIRLEGRFDWTYGVTWSPGDDRLAFVTTRPGEYQTELRVMDRDGKHQLLLLTDTLPISAPVWSDDGAALYYLTQQPTTTEILRVAASGRTAPVVVAVMPWATEVESKRSNMSGSGGRLVVVRSTRSSNIGRLDLDHPSALPQFYTAGTAQDRSARISPNGREFAFLHWENGLASIEVMPLAGGPRELLARVGDGFELAWSPDGRHLAALSTYGNGPPAMVVVDRERGSTGRLAEGHVSGYLTWLDDHRVLYQRVGNRRIGMVDIRSGEDTVLPGPDAGFLYDLRASPDGRTIALNWNGPAGRGIGLLGLDDTIPRLVAENALPVRWSGDGRLLYVSPLLPATRFPTFQASGTLLAVGAAGGTPTIVHRLPVGYTVSDISTDGKVLLVNRDETHADAWLVELGR